MVKALAWNPDNGPSKSVTLMNGEKIKTGSLKGDQAALFVGLSMWASVANIQIRQTHDVTSANFKFLLTDSAGMQRYFNSKSDAETQGVTTLPNNFAANYDVDSKRYSPGYSFYNVNGSGWGKLSPGSEGFWTILHETGHLLGLDHPWNEGGHYLDDGKTAEPGFPGSSDERKGAFGLNQSRYTVMSYNYSGTDGDGDVAGLGAFDIAAVQALYGANMKYRIGNDTYVLPTQNGSDVGWFCLWDAGGKDTIKIGKTNKKAVIDLRAATLVEAYGAGGYASHVDGVSGGFTIANGVIIETAIGSDGDDTLIGNDANNLLEGGAGDDVLIGGKGVDQLRGGAGKDIFVFRAHDYSRSSNSDKILDFDVADDKIDVSSLGEFKFRANAGDMILGQSNQLLLLKGSLLGYIDGDHIADFQIQIGNVKQLSANNFIGAT